MGYPMTYRRLVNRNRLSQGDYDHQSLAPFPHVRLDDPLCGYQDVEALERAYRNQFKVANEERAAARSRINLILGDLRRLELDTVDEASICQVIANKTALAPAVVAAVLKEWIAT